MRKVNRKYLVNKMKRIFQNKRDFLIGHDESLSVIIFSCEFYRFQKLRALMKKDANGTIRLILPIII